MDIALALIAAFGGAGFFAFLQFLIQRKDKRKDELVEIKGELKKLHEQSLKEEKSLCRLELSRLIDHAPEQQAAILNGAEHYFVELKGDWYMTAAFQKYLQENDIEVPLWFSNN